MPLRCAGPPFSSLGCVLHTCMRYLWWCASSRDYTELINQHTFQVRFSQSRRRSAAAVNMCDYSIPRIMFYPDNIPPILPNPVARPAWFDQVHGTSVGGDTDELRLLSTNETRINILAHGGSLDFVSTKVRLVMSGRVSQQCLVSDVASPQRVPGRDGQNLSEVRRRALLL